MIFVNIFFVYIATICFGILVNVPHRALNLDGIVGVLGWLVYYIYINAFGSSSYIGANFFGTLTIGIAGILASRYKKLPVIIFNIPGLVPLVPGGQAYQVMRDMALNDYGLAKFNFLQVAFIAGSISAGFLVAEVLNQLVFKARHYRSPRHYHREKVREKAENEKRRNS
ncbi:threonine/serine exporter family protein [Nicoliella spurrieriana]|uniref:Threonine/serine exporter family protein n=1 Tax=Nicoliella spurrieriana TaxID=2925830 RepID=A0A976RR28_9LACO|nr:threonine/serine exporter family protein [Nicoliella spurrieriana]UQS86330.1 threonine/serine exporter family protein [Nicoliella spurrieriana]